MPTISPLSLVRNGPVPTRPPSTAALREEVARVARQAMEETEALAGRDRLTFREAERAVRTMTWAWGRALIAWLLAVREERVVAALPPGRVHGFERTFRRAPPIARNLTTLFGPVRYWRTYLRQVDPGPRSGFYPLDQSLGLGADRVSWNVLAQAVRLATELSFARAKATLSEFVPNAPSTEVIEGAMLGFGAHAEAFFAMQPAPEDDGEILVIEVDGKAVPTATAQELAKRRGRRPGRAPETSPRHRGRAQRQRCPKGPRRKKGDKAKNGKGATMVVMYTLRRRGTRRLEGPLNRRLYVTFASKRRAFEVARREATKRGFGPEEGRRVQLVTDGDPDLARLGAEYFPGVEHTLDAYHAFERLWSAAHTLWAEGSTEAKAWVDAQKQALFDDDPQAVLDELQRRLDLIAKTGPGTKSKRERLTKVHAYLAKRVHMVRYRSLRRRDLVLGTGQVEGAIKHVLGKRCDHGGMRWIKERVQPVAQLRCIDINGDWEAFELFVHRRQHAAALLNSAPTRIQRRVPEELRHAA